MTANKIADAQDVAPQPPLKLQYLEGLRGVLMFLVLLIHIRIALIYPKLVDYDSFRITSWILPAYYIMGAFLALSGYCLMLPVARSRDGRMRGSIWDFFVRRARRLLPPYYIALAISLAMLFLLPSRMTFHFRQPEYDTSPIAIWTHLLLIQNLKVEWRYLINAPLWYVAMEWQLYPFFPLLFVPIWRRYGSKALAVVAAVIGLAPLGPLEATRQTHAWYIFLFALGMIAAVIQHSERPVEKRWRERFNWGAIAAGMFAIYALAWGTDMVTHRDQLHRIMPDWRRFCIFDIWFGVATLALILYCGQTQAAQTNRRPSLVLTFLNHPWIAGMGIFSYSHFLVHFPIIMSVREMTRELGLTPHMTYLVMFLVAIPLSLLGGYLFYLAVERRFLPQYRRKAVVVPVPPVYTGILPALEGAQVDDNPR